jgi:hypothetical protein
MDKDEEDEDEKGIPVLRGAKGSHPGEKKNQVKDPFKGTPHLAIFQ